MPINPVPPSSRNLRCLAVSASNGWLQSILALVAASCTCTPIVAELAPGPRPPSNNGFDASTITFPASKFHLLPKPWHVSHAPYGLLKENERGSISGTLVPQFGHADFCEYSRSSPSTTATITSPSAIFMAVASDVSRRCSMPGFTTNRSMTTSIVWFLRLSKLISSSSERNSPSTRARR